MAPDNAADIPDAVIDRYSRLARTAIAGGTPVDGDPDACTAGLFGAAAYPVGTEGVPDAALRASLGCGNPLAVADLRPGEIVLDLGSGGGLDVLLSARRVAPGGLAYGLDASADMLALARANAAQAGVTSARFLHGRIEAIPLPDEHVDVIISNCVINLSASKERVLAEAFRVLRPGGRLGHQRHDRRRGHRPWPARPGRAAGWLHQRHPHHAALPCHAASRRIRRHHHHQDPPRRGRRALRHHPRGQADHRSAIAEFRARRAAGQQARIKSAPLILPGCRMRG